MITFRINGQVMTLSRTQVEEAVRRSEPDTFFSHAVEVDGRLFPMKQAFALATGLDRLDFTTNQARTQFKRLGYEVTRI